jgi:RNA polymerase sigma factor (sigma-70 family)
MFASPRVADLSVARWSSAATLMGTNGARVVEVTETAEPPSISTTVQAPDWAAVFAEHYSVMYAAAASVLGGQSALGVDADDVVSIALNEAIRRGIPADIEQLHSYLAGIARRRAIDALRRRKHQASDPPDPATELAPRIARDGPDVLAVKAELASEVAGHLDVLPERERFALEQSVMRDRTRAEVAEELKVTPQRVSQLVNAGLGRLRLLPTFAERASFDTQESGGSTASGTRP